MKIQYASDLHLEFPENLKYITSNPLQVEGDILVLAGDIHVLGAGRFDQHPFFQWCSEHFTNTFIVPGNHEYYDGHDLEATLTDWQLPILPNVSFINNRSVVIGDTELFFTTLWSKIPPVDYMLVNKCLTDCYRMVYRNEPFKAHHYDEVHRHCLTWLENALKTSSAVHRVVVSHHCPMLLEDPRYESNGLTWAFVVPLERFIEQSGVDAWIFGHTHYNGGRGMRLGNTIMYTNQLGYVKDGIEHGFDPAAIFEI